ncbi:MAG: sensor histidine kinase [Flavisolibacter sp.]|jgi:two-component system phosphate regulon sensor histidine kinase PhoR
MLLRSRTIRLGILISTCIISAIIIFQLIWLKKVYNYEQKEFTHGIARAVRGFYEDINESIQQNNNLNEIISSPNDHTFYIKIDRKFINPDTVEVFMQSELEDEDIFTDSYVGLYDASLNKYSYVRYLPSPTAATKDHVTLNKSGLPFNHLTLYFPHRKQYILSLMNIWIISSIVLLFVLLLFSTSLYYFYRQKFLNETQKDFVNNFTHEFKTPVAVINLAAEVLSQPGIREKPEKMAKYAAIVQYQGKYLQDQIERLLKHAWSERRALFLHKEKVNMHALINEAINNLDPLVQEKNANISCELDAMNQLLFADRGYLLIVLTNILENALKYTTHPKILVSTANNNGSIFVSIKDNGKGIEKKYLTKVFRKFYRVPNGEQVSTRGFGLGLSFVKKIVTAHKGKIHVESIPGIGSNFEINLPIL